MPQTAPTMNERITQGNPEVARIIAEMTALNTALRATENPQEVSDALRLVRQVRADRSDPATFEDFVILVAMSRVLNEPASPSLPREIPLEATTPVEIIFKLTAHAWVAWALHSGEDVAFARLREHLARHTAAAKAKDGGGVHLLALESWASAVQALHIGAHTEAERYFKRAAEIGGSFGTESHPIILWSMAASFFPPAAVAA